jgi:hypothetical protein
VRRWGRNKSLEIRFTSLEHKTGVSDDVMRAEEYGDYTSPRRSE